MGCLLSYICVGVQGLAMRPFHAPFAAHSFDDAVALQWG